MDHNLNTFQKTFFTIHLSAYFNTSLQAYLLLASLLQFETPLFNPLPTELHERVNAAAGCYCVHVAEPHSCRRIWKPKPIRT